MREKPKDNTRLRHMLEAINNVIEFTTDVTFEEYSRNKILRFAVIKNLEIVGEAAYLITKEFREEHQEIAWNEVIGMRHVLVHGDVYKRQPYIQLGGKILYRQSDIEKLLEENYHAALV